MASELIPSGGGGGGAAENQVNVVEAGTPLRETSNTEKKPEEEEEQKKEEVQNVLGVPIKGAWADEDMLECIGGVPPAGLTTRNLYVLKTMSGLNAYFDSIPALEAGVHAWRRHVRQWFGKLLREAKDVKIEASDYEKSGFMIVSSNNGNLSRECPANKLPELLAFIQGGCEPDTDINKFLDLCIPICDDAEVITERLLGTTRP